MRLPMSQSFTNHTYVFGNSDGSRSKGGVPGQRSCSRTRGHRAVGITMLHALPSQALTSIWMSLILRVVVRENDIGREGLPEAAS
jgi:hypothetical protein